TAKRELEQDPKNFIGYTEEDFEEVKDVKGKKHGSKIKEIIMFLPNVMKQYWAYSKYRKTEYKQNQILREQLLKQDVSEAQLRDAKNLQSKLFNTFEKVDDNSQIYSESMEAATEIAQPFVYYGAALAAVSPAIFYGVQVAKGKITTAKLAKDFVNLTEKITRLSKKPLQRYLNSVDKNISAKVQGTRVQNRPIAGLIKDVDFKDPVGAVEKMIDNIRTLPDALRKMDADTQNQTIWEFQHKVDNLLDSVSTFDKEKANNIKAFVNKEIFSKLNHHEFYKNPELRPNVLDIMLGNTKAVEKMDDEAFNAAMKYVDSTSSIQKSEYLSKMTKVGEEISELKAELAPLKATIDELYNGVVTPMAAKIKEGAKHLNIKNFTSIAKSGLEKMDDKEFAQLINRFGVDIDRKTVLEMLPKLEKIMDNIPKEHLAKIKNTLLKEFQNNPDEFVHLLQNGGLMRKVLFTPELKTALAVAGASWVALNIIIAYIIEQWLAEMQLKAGRLGVMKAIESLDDPAYYANIEVVNENTTPPAQSGNLLNKFK
ncbi:MAG: hypothetical protein LBJ74_00590, partial [Heliobacteriaceae bacterium]|nr:hypothetical protein [Heliobacteriaceae bacterium]